MHQRIWTNGMKWSAKIEGAYIPQEFIRRYDPSAPPCPTVNEGRFYVGNFGSDWIIQRHVVRECGVVLAGPDPKTLIDHVSSDDLRYSVIESLNEWWFLLLDDPSWLQSHECNYHGFTVITMCRALHTLQHGIIASKPVAAKWAQEKFGSRWSELISKAIATQYGEKYSILNETLDFICFTQEQVKQYQFNL